MAGVIEDLEFALCPWESPPQGMMGEGKRFDSVCIIDCRAGGAVFGGNVVFELAFVLDSMSVSCSHAVVAARTFILNLAPSFLHPGLSSNFHSAPDSFSASNTSSNFIVNSSIILRFGLVSSRAKSGITSSVGTRSGATGLLPNMLNRNAMVEGLLSAYTVSGKVTGEWQNHRDFCAAGGC